MITGVIVHSIKFQSTHPSGVRLRVVGLGLGATYFNPRTPVGCDVARNRPMRLSSKFQSTHPSGVRLFFTCFHRTTSGISIHAPQWGATGKPTLPTRVAIISIHAPQWGATPVIPVAGQTCPISIHAPQWGATTWHSPTAVPWRYFNPRTPVGCDLRLLDGRLGDVEISIHAPQWGATKGERT